MPDWFTPRELLAWVNDVLRHEESVVPAEPDKVIRFGYLWFDAILRRKRLSSGVPIETVSGFRYRLAASG